MAFVDVEEVCREIDAMPRNTEEKAALHFAVGLVGASALGDEAKAEPV